MKILLSLSLLCAFVSNSIVGMDNDHDDLAHSIIELKPSISHSLAKEWSDVEPFKDPVYMPFFEKNGYKKEYLETRWTALENFYKTQIASIILLRKSQNPVGFLTVESKDDNVLLYTSPMLIDPKEIDIVALNAIKDFYPQVTMGYCMAAKNNEKMQKFLLKLGWKHVEKSPITPSKDFIDNIDYVVFSHAVENSK